MIFLLLIKKKITKRRGEQRIALSQTMRVIEETTKSTIKQIRELNSGYAMCNPTLSFLTKATSP